jgi:hypothetical protein
MQPPFLSKSLRKEKVLTRRAHSLLHMTLLIFPLYASGIVILMTSCVLLPRQSGAFVEGHCSSLDPTISSTVECHTIRV